MGAAEPTQKGCVASLEEVGGDAEPPKDNVWGPLGRSGAPPSALRRMSGVSQKGRGPAEPPQTQLFLSDRKRHQKIMRSKRVET